MDAASNANEALNVLKVTFKGNTDEVLAWSKTLGAEMGRSEYTLQEAAGKFGAFLGPVFRDSGQDIAGMSKQLSELAVDLASFYNTSDEEAQMRLFSGMSGETEAVRRLGIDISDTSLDDFNKKSGDNRRMASLTLAEKSLLRFKKILRDTEEKQGDAARTADQWANSVKRVKDKLKTMAVDIGRRLMPAAMALLNALERTIHNLAEGYKLIVVRTHAIEVALTAAGAALAYFVATSKAARDIWLTMQVIVAMWNPATTAAVMAAAKGFALMAGSFVAIAGVALVIEDLIGFLAGNSSVTGDLITELTGLTNPLQAVHDVAENVATDFMNIVTAIKNMIMFFPRVASALGSGTSMFDAVTGAGDMRQGMTDGDQMSKQRQSARDDAFTSAMQSGDGAQMKAAIANSRRPMETDVDAVKRMYTDRAAYVAADPSKANEKDYQAGLTRVHSATMPTMSIAPSAAAQSSMSQNQTVNIQKIEVNGTFDPSKAIQKIVSDFQQSSIKATRDNQLGTP